MPGTVSEAPSVSLSFANNFWGKDDAGVAPLLDRMHGAKVTSDELKAFYSSRASIEEEYARKLLSLARKPLGSAEGGTLRMSLDVVRGEVESMGKAHQNIAQQMKTELDEALAAHAGGMKERRKIVQGGIEKLLKTKNQQSAILTKARDRYEQDCLKIKGYLAQGHMVMGQEERKNKAKLEKTQIQLSTSSKEYEAAVKVIEETTGRWNREWKAACDKFQDLEEERIDFMKTSLWSFANIASTVCVSDDASCEKVRLSLEDCEVEKDISTFIKEHGTGQEIPDPPKFINFCRGDLSDTASDVDADENYSVAQFQRTINPAYRSSSPQPTALGSEVDIASSPVQEHISNPQSTSGSPNTTPRKTAQQPQAESYSQRGRQFMAQSLLSEDLPEVPHNEYPTDGMTQFCRPVAGSDLSSNLSQARPISRDSHSEISNLTSVSSQVPSLGNASPTKQMSELSMNENPDQEMQKKKSGFFQNRSPFRRKSKSEKDRPLSGVPPGGNRVSFVSPTDRHHGEASDSGNRMREPQTRPGGRVQAHTGSSEKSDPRASYQLNVGNNVFDVASPDAHHDKRRNYGQDGPEDPMAEALAQLKNVSKQASVRMSADRYHGLATPAPGASPASANRNRAPQLSGSNRDQAPPSYPQQPKSLLGAPQPAHTARQMQQTTQRYVQQNQSLLNSSSRPQDNSQSRDPREDFDTGRRTSNQGPARSRSPRPDMRNSGSGQGNLPRAASPNPYLNGGGYSSSPANRPRAQSTSPIKPGYSNTSQGGSPNQVPRATSPQPPYNSQARPSSGGQRLSGDMSMQLAQGPPPRQPYGQAGQMSSPSRPQQYEPRGRMGGGPGPGNGPGRPRSQFMDGSGGGASRPGPEPNRMRSKSAAPDTRQQYTWEGRAILHFSRAVYMYQAAIPEELSFNKGDILAVLRHQDDGWWEAEVHGKRVRPGLVPSNYLAPA